MLDLISDNEMLAWSLAVVSVLTFFATLLAVPYAVVRIPKDYFLSDNHAPLVAAHRPVLRMVWQSFKTLLGLLLVLLGFAMLVLPGQGILTILVGIMLLKFPGKYRLQYWLVSRPQVFRSLNWLRRRSGREPLQLR